MHITYCFVSFYFFSNNLKSNLSYDIEINIKKSWDPFRKKKGFGRLTITLRLAEQQPMSVTTEIKL